MARYSRKHFWKKVSKDFYNTFMVHFLEKKYLKEMLKKLCMNLIKIPGKICCYKRTTSEIYGRIPSGIWEEISRGYRWSIPCRKFPNESLRIFLPVRNSWRNPWQPINTLLKKCSEDVLQKKNRKNFPKYPQFKNFPKYPQFIYL